MLCFEDLDNLLLLDEESSDDALFDTLVAEDTPIHPLHSLLSVAKPRALRRPGGLDTSEFALALATPWDLLGLLDILVNQATAWRSYSESNIKIVKNLFWVGALSFSSLCLELSLGYTVLVNFVRNNKNIVMVS